MGSRVVEYFPIFLMSIKYVTLQWLVIFLYSMTMHIIIPN